MRPLRLLHVLLLGLTVCLPASGLAAQRVALLETFTNVSCGYCPANNSAVHTFATDFGTARAVNVQYHVNWPSATDPFYLAASADVNARRTYYGVNGVTTNEMDGGTIDTQSLPPIVESATVRLGMPAPLELDATATWVTGDTLEIAVSVTAVAEVPASGLKLRVSLTEPYVNITPAPGSNGETNFYCTHRKFLPNATGTTVSITNGQTLNYAFRSYVDKNAWHDIYAVAWVQNDNTKEVLQAGCTLAPANYAFFYGWYDHADVWPRGTLRGFRSLISNVGALQDTYAIQIAESLPANWSASVCANGTCYPPGTTNFNMTVAPGTQDSIRVDITPLDTPGTGTVTITATSQNNPADDWAQTFKLISDGITVLIVDDDGGKTYENSFYQALAANGLTSYATWKRLADGNLSPAQLDRFHTVMWETGLSIPTLDPNDRASLGAYLDAGGFLFVAGQDVGWDMCDSTTNGSGFSTVESRAWYRNYLGARWIRDDTNDTSVTGVAGTIFDGVTLALSGATQTYPDEINPYGTGVGNLIYVAGQEAAVQKQIGSSKVVYFGFGFEGLTTVTQRNTVMQRILNWFGTSTVSVEQPAATPPYLASRPVAGPNPFNPLTHVKFAIGGIGSAKSEVSIFDVQGRRVRTLFKGVLPAGPHDLVWDGRSQSGRPMPSGLYLARVTVNGESKSVKMTLAK